MRLEVRRSLPTASGRTSAAFALLLGHQSAVPADDPLGAVAHLEVVHSGTPRVLAMVVDASAVVLPDSVAVVALDEQTAVARWPYISGWAEGVQTGLGQTPADTGVTAVCARACVHLHHVAEAAKKQLLSGTRPAILGAARVSI